MDINFSRLEQNLCDVIKEEQVKLGYRKEAIRLYYPLLSLNRLLKTDGNISEMKKILLDFCIYMEEKLGKIEVSNEGERFCFSLPPEAAEYVHTHTPGEGFLYDFISTVSKHPVTMEEVIDQFHKYSTSVHVEPAGHGDFDVLVYFEDGSPDSFRYCLTDEGCHVIYHRFTPEDYEDLWE